MLKYKFNFTISSIIIPFFSSCYFRNPFLYEKFDKRTSLRFHTNFASLSFIHTQTHRALTLKHPLTHSLLALTDFDWLNCVWSFRLFKIFMKVHYLHSILNWGALFHDMCSMLYYLTQFECLLWRYFHCLQIDPVSKYKHTPLNHTFNSFDFQYLMRKNQFGPQSHCEWIWRMCSSQNVISPFQFSLWRTDWCSSFSFKRENTSLHTLHSHTIKYDFPLVSLRFFVFIFSQDIILFIKIHKNK